MLAAPVDAARDFRLFVQVHVLQDPFAELIKTCPVHDVTDVLFALKGVGINILLHISVGVLDHLEDALLVRPFDEVLCQTRILLAGASHDDNAEIVLLAPCPGAGRAVGDAYTASDALGGIPHHFAVDKGESSHGTDVTVLDALLAAHAAVRIILGFRHADEAEVVHPHLAAVVKAILTCRWLGKIILSIFLARAVVS